MVKKEYSYTSTPPMGHRACTEPQCLYKGAPYASPLLVPWSRKSTTIPLLPLWAVRPVQSLSACTRVHFTLPYFRCESGSTVFKVLCYKSEGWWLDPSWCQWKFSLTQIPSDRTMALGSSQPLTEMSTRRISWG